MKKLYINFDAAFFIFALYLIINGALRREDSFLTAETGLGYTLGIVGSSMMLLLLLYPLRKHNRLMQRLGSVKYWFRMHMLLGVAGPVLILYHANFGLGSTNSNVALISMVIVASSGVFGRIFYTKIHDGLYGRKIALSELQTELNNLKQGFSREDEIDVLLNKYQQNVLKSRGLFVALIFMPYLHLTSIFMRNYLLKRIKILTNDESVSTIGLHEKLSSYFKLLLRASDFTIYERLFSLWHVLHIPLFMMMLVSGVIHVIAVHLY